MPEPRTPHEIMEKLADFIRQNSLVQEVYVGEPGERPSTEAGRALLDADDWGSWGNLRDAILAIEAEAATPPPDTLPTREQLAAVIFHLGYSLTDEDPLDAADLILRDLA